VNCPRESVDAVRAMVIMGRITVAQTTSNYYIPKHKLHCFRNYSTLWGRIMSMMVGRKAAVVIAVALLLNSSRGHGLVMEKLYVSSNLGLFERQLNVYK
jgi:hypothetical protein